MDRYQGDCYPRRGIEEAWIGIKETATQKRPRRSRDQYQGDCYPRRGLEEAGIGIKETATPEEA